MTDFVPSEKGVPIRFPSTAYLNIDSTDRFSVTGAIEGERASNFQINRRLNVLNGYFTRLAVQEVVCDWCIDNISSTWGNSVFQVAVPDLSGTLVSIQLEGGNYTIEEALDAIVAELNSATASTDWSLGTTPYGAKTLDLSGSNFTILPNNLQTELNFQADVSGNSFPCACPKLLPITYIDFASPVLGQNQEVYDSTTNPIERNLLYRWWLAWDNQPIPFDGYGYPILQGYKPSVADSSSSRNRLSGLPISQSALSPSKCMAQMATSFLNLGKSESLSGG